MKVFKPSFSFRNWRIIAILFFPVQWFFFSLIGSYPHFIENWYSEGLYRFLSLLLRGLTTWVPFSVGEVVSCIVVIVVVFRLVWGFVQLAKKQIKFKSLVLRSLYGLLAWTSVIYFLFMVLWGLNYHREELVSFEVVGIKGQDFKNQDFKSQDFKNQDLESQDFKNQNARLTVFSTNELIGLCEILIEKSNLCRKEALSRSNNPNKLFMENDTIIRKAYSWFHDIVIQDKKLDYRIPSVKPILFTEVFSYLGVGGIYNPFTGEANVNMDPPGFLLPATVCHEMAHQAGIAPEDEANYVAYVVCRQHPDPFFQYSGFVMAMRYAMGTLKRDDRSAYNELQKQIGEGVKSDLEENRKYWDRFKNPFEKYSDRIYDQYLKANSQQAGIKSYGRMVRLLLWDHRQAQVSD
ncbi:MAG: DUF3810 domain-containing protein [Chlorobi bacterium]|nr:DUF3810 domain-containing protein [Chlorobiota bacterium]